MLMVNSIAVALRTAFRCCPSRRCTSDASRIPVLPNGRGELDPLASSLLTLLQARSRRPCSCPAAVRSCWLHLPDARWQAAHHAIARLATLPWQCAHTRLSGRTFLRLSHTGFAHGTAACLRPSHSHHRAAGERHLLCQRGGPVRCARPSLAWASHCACYAAVKRLHSAMALQLLIPCNRPAEDESYVLVVETFGMRVLRHWLAGPKAGTTDVRGQGCWATAGCFGCWSMHAWLLQHARMLGPCLASCPPGSVGQALAQPNLLHLLLHFCF